MSKMSVKWHQDCLGNMVRHVGESRAKLARLQAEVQRDELAIEFRQRQIDTALYEGKKEFDGDKYLKNRSQLII